MGYRYFVAPIEPMQCELCKLPDIDKLHSSQAGSVYQCDKCSHLYELRIKRRGGIMWFPVNAKSVADKIK